MNALKAPFPYFGGKKAIAPKVWKRFGNPKNYVEPFFGSGAMLLARPEWHFRDSTPVETVNDLDALLTNFWRALTYSPTQLARAATYPVSELDLHARHYWLIHGSKQIQGMVRSSTHFYDVQTAAWWVWGISQWIGDGWCQRAHKTKPMIGKGYGNGIHGLSMDGDALGENFELLSDRMRRVRILSGDWKRAIPSSSTRSYGETAVFLDPPYGHGDANYATAKATDKTVANEVWEWAVEHGANENMRIAVCGYEDGRALPDGWECINWKGSSGYGVQSAEGNTNRDRERVWFSPHCIKINKSQLELFT